MKGLDEKPANYKSLSASLESKSNALNEIKISTWYVAFAS